MSGKSSDDAKIWDGRSEPLQGLEGAITRREKE